MKHAKYLLLSLLLVLVAGSGCARAARDTTGFAVSDSVTIGAAFTDTWQAAKAVMREMDLEIYTRDKRGVFVAFTPAKRRGLFGRSRRTRVTVTLERVASETTSVKVEVMDQIYGVTLLTYPDWHDRKTTDKRVANEFVEALQAKLS